MAQSTRPTTDDEDIQNYCDYIRLLVTLGQIGNPIGMMKLDARGWREKMFTKTTSYTLDCFIKAYELFLKETQIKDESLQGVIDEHIQARDAGIY